MEVECPPCVALHNPSIVEGGLPCTVRTILGRGLLKRDRGPKENPSGPGG
jgi:hypothetical protein